MAARRVKQKDIAVEAGVSEATVSRFRNEPHLLSEEKRLSIADAIKRLGLGTQASLTLGLIVPDTTNPFFSQLIYLFERALAREGALLISASSDGRLDREVDLVERFKGLGAAGLFYTPTREGSQAILNIASTDMPILAFDREVPTGNLDTVTTECRQAMQTLVDFLVNQGHRRFAWIHGVAGTTTANERAEAFGMALSRNELTIRGEHIFEGNYRFSAGRDCAEAFLAMEEKERPTAVVAANDLMAIGFMQRVQEQRLSIPHHVSVCGFDGIEFGAWYSPSLATIVQPVRRLVHEATRLLLERVSATGRGETLERRRVRLEPMLAIRDSVGPAPTPERLRPNSSPSLELVTDPRQGG